MEKEEREFQRKFNDHTKHHALLFLNYSYNLSAFEKNLLSENAWSIKPNYITQIV